MNRLILCGLLWAAQATALDTSQLRPQGYVSDFAGALDAGARLRIEQYCGSIERSTQAQFAVVVVKSLEGETAEDVGVRLFKQWGIGDEKRDDGLLFLLAIEDRQQRIETGYGMEEYITDAFAGTVMRSIRPILRQGNYGEAIGAAVQQLGNRLAAAKGVAIDTGRPAPAQRSRPSSDFGFGGVIGGIILLLFVLSLFGGGRGRGGRGGNAGSMVAGLILGSMLNQRGGRGGWSHGGFGGSGGGWGGGGFGGFGGGGSGGGGASSSW